MRAGDLKEGDRVMWFHGPSSSMQPTTIHRMIRRDPNVYLHMKRIGERGIDWNGPADAEILMAGEDATIIDMGHALARPGRVSPDHDGGDAA